MPLPRPLTAAEQDAFRDSSGGIRINDIFLSQGLEPIDFQSQPEESETLLLPRHSTHAELDEWIRIYDIFQSQDVLPPETLPLPPPLPRPLTDAELDTFRDSSGGIRINDIFLSQGLEPIVFQFLPEEPETLLLPRHSTHAELDEWIRIYDIFQSQDVLPPEPLPPPLPRPLTDAELDTFHDSSGGIRINDIFLSQGLEPIFQPQDFVPPPEEPETPIHYLTQTELDALADSSGSIDNNAIFLSQGGEPVMFQTEAEFASNAESWGRTDYDAHLLSYRSKGLTEETISKYLKKMNADEIKAHDKDGDRKICAVCLDDMCGHKDIVAILDDCGHEFHYCCLKKWLLRKNICPLCRRTAIFR